MQSLSLKKEKGFTLIEILIVITIIAVLASAVLLGLGPVQRKGRDGRRISDLRQVQNALELYFAKCGYYPGPSAAASCAGFASLGDSWATLKSNLETSGIGISNVPNDPTPGKSYHYGTDGAGTSYVIGAKLEDSNTALSQDVDGTVFTIDCGSGTNGDPATDVYCVQL